MKKNVSKWVLPAMVLILNACTKDDFPNQPVVSPAKGVYVLNEGGFGANNASLGYYDFTSSTYSGGIFQQQNGFKLGDVANDAIIYGGKMYIVMNNSGVLMIANAANGKFIDSVSFKNPTTKASTQPRNVVAHEGKVYVSTWLDGVKVIDTTNFAITQKISLRNYGEGLAITNGKLCVALGGPWGSADSVVSIFTLSSGTLEKYLKVGKNLGQVIADNSGNIIVRDGGEYDFITDKYVNGSLSKIDVSTGQITHKALGSFGKSYFFNNNIYSLSGYNETVKVRVFKAGDMTVSKDNFITDDTQIINPYGMNIDETNGDVYILDAKDYITSGAVNVFDKTGKKKYSFTTTGGINPNAVLFKR